MQTMMSSNITDICLKRFTSLRTEFDRIAFAKTLKQSLKIHNKVSGINYYCIDHVVLNSLDAHDDIVQFVSSIKILAWNPDSNIISVKLEGLHNYFEEACKHEILVHCIDTVEGCHMRCENLARGGIRKHSGLEDFFKVCYDLATNQQVKNSVISMGGSKGVYRDLNNLGLEAYQSYVKGLLQICNYLKEKIFIAADIGTGDYSDEALYIAHKMNYSVPNIFASGSSKGLHHKNLGITSHGALTVFEHQLHNYSKNNLTVVAIGSMRGDVMSNFFANAAKYNISLRLIGAISSKYVYLNPFVTREEQDTINKTNKGWEHINSQNCFVLERNQNAVNLDKKIADFFDLPVLSTPNQVIKALLAYKVDLLFSGGAGTWIVNNPLETQAQISPQQVRAKFIVEGGNLAIDHSARPSLKLERPCYGDYIDNSAAVRLSDYEIQYLHYLTKFYKYKEGAARECINSMSYILVKRVLSDLKKSLERIDDIARMNEHRRNIIKTFIKRHYSYSHISVIGDRTSDFNTSSSLYSGLLAVFKELASLKFNKNDVIYLQDYYSTMHGNYIPFMITYRMQQDPIIMTLLKTCKAHRMMDRYCSNPDLLDDLFVD